MEPICVTRSNNLRAFAKANGGLGRVAKTLGQSNSSYMSQLAGKNPTRALKYQTARRYEQLLGLEDGWLDADHSQESLVDMTDIQKSWVTQPGDGTIKHFAKITSIATCLGIALTEEKIASILKLYLVIPGTDEEKDNHLRQLIMLTN